MDPGDAPSWAILWAESGPRPLATTTHSRYVRPIVLVACPNCKAEMPLSWSAYSTHVNRGTHHKIVCQGCSSDPLYAVEFECGSCRERVDL